MPVRHALLALLAQRDLTGYELKVRFERALGELWQLNSGQVYSTLDRLRRAGMIARHSEERTVARARYTLLPRGRRALDDWLEAPLPRLKPVRDPLFVKLVFTPPERLPALVEALTGEARRYRTAIDMLDALVAREPLSVGARTRWLVAEAARLSYDAQLAWLKRAEHLLAPSTGASRADAHSDERAPSNRTPLAEPLSRRPPARAPRARPAIGA